MAQIKLKRSCYVIGQRRTSEDAKVL